MQAPLGDARLRELGEKLAARYPGYHDMGISPVAKVSALYLKTSSGPLILCDIQESPGLRIYSGPQDIELLHGLKRHACPSYLTGLQSHFRFRVLLSVLRTPESVMPSIKLDDVKPRSFRT